MGVALPKDDWTPAKLKEHRAWRSKMYAPPSVKKIPVRHLSAQIAPPPPVEMTAQVSVVVHFGYPILPLERYKTFQFVAIQRACCAAGGIGMRDMLSKFTEPNLVKARHIAILLCKMLGPIDVSMPVIGRRFGGRDHTTIYYTLKKLEPVREAIERRVSKTASLQEYVAAAFDAFDQIIAPRQSEAYAAARRRASELPRSGSRWTAK